APRLGVRPRVPLTSSRPPPLACGPAAGDTRYEAVDDRVVAALRCPHGEASLALDGRTLVCPGGHRFDLARQGYVNLLRGAAPAGVETSEMVAARVEIQQAGHHDPLTNLLKRTVAASPQSHAGQRLAVDVGAGTGHHLAAVVEASGGGCA